MSDTNLSDLLIGRKPLKKEITGKLNQVRSAYTSWVTTRNDMKRAKEDKEEQEIDFEFFDRAGGKNVLQFRRGCKIAKQVLPHELWSILDSLSEDFEILSREALAELLALGATPPFG